jgi:hypothetical protein
MRSSAEKREAKMRREVQAREEQGRQAEGKRALDERARHRASAGPGAFHDAADEEQREPRDRPLSRSERQPR